MQRKGARHRGSDSSGFTSTVTIHLWLILAAVVILLALLPSTSSRLTALGLLALVVLILVLRNLRGIIRKGDEVEVTRKGPLLGRKASVTNVLEFGSVYEVKLYPGEVKGEMASGETATLYSHDLKKLR